MQGSNPGARHPTTQKQRAKQRPRQHRKGQPKQQQKKTTKRPHLSQRFCLLLHYFQHCQSHRNWRLCLPFRFGQKQSLFGTKMTALFSKANFLFGKQCPTKNKRQKKKLLNKQFVFSVNKRGNFVLPTLVSCAHVAYVYLTYSGITHVKKFVHFESMKYISHPYLLHFKGGLGGPHLI